MVWPVFSVSMPDALSDLAIETIDLADLSLTNLVLHSVTVDGVISWRQQVKLAGINSPEPRSYGQALALSLDGNTLVVGADRVGEISGVVFVYTRSGDNWIEQAKLYPDDRLSGGGMGFGRSVAIDGTLLLVGAPQDINRGYDTGAVYIYRLANGAWTQEWKLRGGGSYYKFGTAVDVDVTNGRILVGAPGANTVYYYTYQSSELINKWPQKSSFSGSGEFGTALDLISSAYVLVGAPGANSIGEAYLYGHDGNNIWSKRATFESTSEQAGERFGAAVALKENNGRLVVGSPNYKGENNEQGAAWIFEGSGANWNMVARLTADGGLPPNEATHEGNAGDHFGASVTIYGDYVAVGAPDYDGNSANQGKVYVFYRHERYCGGACDPVAWTRSLNLASSAPAESEYFGKALVLGDKRLIIGVPGFNETDGSNNITRNGIGTIRTYTTDGSLAINDIANSNTGLYRAEALSGEGNFGRKVIYDLTTKELIVSAYGVNSIYIYTNEGLYWRLIQTITQSGDFGYDMEKDGNNLVVGAPGANKFYIYQRGDDGWAYKTDKTGPSGVGRFGASVAIDGSRIAVGAPDTNLWISSSGQPKTAYQLSLGKTGVAFTYTGSDAAWTLEKFIIPYDARLYFSIFETVTSGGTLLDKMLSYDDGDGDTWEYKNFLNSNSTDTEIKNWLGMESTDDVPLAMNVTEDPVPDPNATSYKIVDHEYFIPSVPSQLGLDEGDDCSLFCDEEGYWFYADYDGTKFYLGDHDDGDWEDDDQKIKLAPRTKVNIYDNSDYSDGPSTQTFENLSYTEWLELNNGDQGYVNDRADDIYVWAHPDGRLQDDQTITITGRTFSGLNNAAFGSSIELNGNTVYIGAPGISGGRRYEIIATDPTYSHWSTAFDTSGNPLLAGADLESDGSLEGDSQDPDTGQSDYAGGSSADIYFNGSYAEWLSAYASYTFNGFFKIVGDPGSNEAKLYEGSTLKSTLHNDGNVDEFGHGVAYVNTGLFLVGTDSAGELFNFRQRGPQWTYRSSTIPAALPSAKFGASVDIDGYTAVVGAPQYDNRGVAFVFEQNPNAETWTLKDQVEGAGTGTGDDFGSAVAIDGGRLIVGAPDANFGKGSVYIFDQVGSKWVENTRLAPSDLASGANFGQAVAIDMDSAVVGAPGMNTIYTYQRESANWEQDSKHTESGSFGSSVAIDGNTLLVGAPTANANSGSVSVYSYGADTWDFQGTLTAADGIAGDAFGTSVDLSLNTTGAATAVVGAPGVNSFNGAAYTFIRTGYPSTWAQQQKLSLNGIYTYYAVGTGDYFGFDVAIDKDILVVGAYKTSISRIIGGSTTTYDNEGGAFAFGLNNGNWQLQTVTKPLFGSDAFNQDYIGYSVAISGTLALAGAPQWDGRPGNALDTDGAGYIYITELSAPLVVTLPKAVSTIIAGERSNTISGKAGAQEIADISFFDIVTFSLNTVAGNHADKVRLDSDGLQAYGLQQFFVSTGPGEDTLTIETDDLSLPTEGKYIPGNFDGYTEGQPLTESQSASLYTRINTYFHYNGGENTTTDKVVFATDSDLTLTGNALVSPIKGRLYLSNVYHVELTAGPSDNTIRASGWAGKVSMDGKGGNDRYELDLSTLANAVVMDSSTNPNEQDELTILGSNSNDSFLLEGTQISVGGKLINVASSGAELIRIAARMGDDTLTVNQVEMSDILLDGMEGSDTYVLNICGCTAAITVKDSSIWGDDVLFINGSSGDDAFTVGENIATCGDSVVIRYDNSLETFIVDGKGGQDSFNISGNPWNVYGSSAVYGGAGDDVIEVSNINKYGLTIDGGSGSDSYRIAASLSGPLTANDRSGTDYLLIDGTSAADTVEVSATEIKLNGATLYNFSSFTSGGLQVSGIEGVNLNLNAGADQVTFNSLPTSVAVAVSGGADDDTFGFTSLSGLYLSGAQYDLRIYGNAGDDRLDLDASANGTGALLENNLSGFGLLRPFYYYDPEGFIAALALSPADDTLTWSASLGSWTVDADAGSDTLLASNQGNIWQISQNDGGYIGSATEFVFNGFENLSGGPGSDEFIFAEGVSISGVLDGGAGSDTFNLSNLANAQTIFLTGNGGSDGYAGIHTVLGGGFDNLDALIGSDFADTLTGPDAVNIWKMTAANAGSLNDTLSFASVENLVGNSQSDTLDFSAYASARSVAVSGSSSVDGYAGTDGSLGVGFDNFNALIGSAFADTLTGPDAVNIWKMTAANAGSLNDTLSFALVENLNGAGMADEFIFADGVGISGEIDGGPGGSNTLNYNAYSQLNSIVVDLIAETATGTLHIHNIQHIIGGNAADTLTGDDAANYITGGPGNDVLTGGQGDDTFFFGDGWGEDTVIELLNGGTDTLDFSGVTLDLTFTLSGVLEITDGSGQKVSHTADNFEVMVAGSGDDTFIILDTITFSGRLDGSAGADTLDLSNYNSSVSMSLGTSTVTAGGISLTVVNIEHYNGGNGDDLIISGSEDELLVGGPGDDTYIFSDNWGQDTVVEISGGGNDIFDFSAVTRNIQFILGSIIVDDGFGNLTVYTGSSVEKIIGGAGDDTIIFSVDGVQLAAGAGTIDGGPGQNTLDYSAYTTTVTVDLAAGTATGTAGISNIQHILGGSGDDFLSGSDGVDTLWGGAGNDVLSGGGGNDTLNGGEGQDQLFGGADADILNGDAGNDTLDGGAGNDALTDTRGNNILLGGDDNDTLIAGDGMDILQGGVGNDTLNGGAGNDQLFGNAGDDTLDGGAGDDNLSGGAGNNTYRFVGNFGTDTIIAATGNDTIDLSTFSVDFTTTISDKLLVEDGSGSSISALGGEIELVKTGSGADSFNFAGNGSLIGTIDSGTGEDRLNFSLYLSPVSVTLNSSGTQDGWAGSASVLGGFDNIEKLVGSAFNDALTGMDVSATWDLTTAPDHRYISNGSSIDFTSFENLFAGSAGDTFLFAGSQALSFFGQDGDDQFIFADQAVLNGIIDGGAGSDTFDLSAYTPGFDVVLSGAASVDSFVGSISGLVNRFQNVDTIIGGSGVDSLVGLNGVNTWIFDGDRKYQNSGKTLSFSALDSLRGGGGADTFLIKSNQTLSLDGGAGDDIFIFTNKAVLTGSVSGGSGFDTFDFSNYVTATTASGFEVRLDLRTGTANFALGGAGQVEKILGSIGSDSLAGGSYPVEFHGGDGGDLLTGGDGADLLYGDANNDIILGGSGNDTIYGGPGIDQINGQRGTDTIFFFDDWGIDIVANDTGAADDIMDFSATSNDLTMVLGSVVAKTGSNIAAHAGGIIKQVIGSQGNDTFIVSPAGTSTNVNVDGGSGLDGLDYSRFQTPVEVNLTSRTGPGLAGFSSIESVLGSNFDDYFVGGPDLDIIFGSDGVDTAVNVQCGIDILVDVENFTCVTASSHSSPSSLPILIPVGANLSSQPPKIIVVYPDTLWVELSSDVPTVLIDALSVMGEIDQIKYLSHISWGPRFAPWVGDLVEIPLYIGGDQALLERVDLPILVTNSWRMILGDDKSSHVLAEKLSQDEGGPIGVSDEENWAIHMSQPSGAKQKANLRVGTFAIADADFSLQASGIEVAQWKFIKALTLRVSNNGEAVSLLARKITISFALPAEMLENAVAFGIMYYDPFTGDCILLEASLLYWDDAANGSLGGWSEEPPFPGATARIFTDQSITGTYVLVALSE